MIMFQIGLCSLIPLVIALIFTCVTRSKSKFWITQKRGYLHSEHLLLFFRGILQNIYEIYIASVTTLKASAKATLLFGHFSIINNGYKYLKKFFYLSCCISLVPHLVVIKFIQMLNTSYDQQEEIKNFNHSINFLSYLGSEKTFSNCFSRLLECWNLLKLFLLDNVWLFYWVEMAWWVLEVGSSAAQTCCGKNLAF